MEGETLLESLNAVLFPLVNAPANPNPAILSLALFAANWVLYAVVAVLAVLWLTGRQDRRRGLLHAIAVAVLALMMNFFIASLWYHPRPFELGTGHQFLVHAPETSFPSDHATILFALAFGLFSAGTSRGVAVLALIAAMLVAWGRVYVGVHWPMDMAGSVVIAAIATGLFAVIGQWPVFDGLWRLVLGLHDRILDRLHIPANLIPRSDVR